MAPDGREEERTHGSLATSFSRLREKVGSRSELG
jgi:hypothetical protein